MFTNGAIWYRSSQSSSSSAEHDAPNELSRPGRVVVAARITLTLRYTRACSRTEITSLSAGPDGFASAVYAGSQPHLSWIDVFSSSSGAAISKTAGSAAAFPTSRQQQRQQSRIATVRDWTAQVGSSGTEVRYDSFVLVRDADTGRTVLEIRDAKTGPLAWSKDGSLLAAGEGRDRLGIWDARTGARVGRVLAHIDEITHAAFTPDGDVVTISRDGTVRVTNPSTGRTLSRLVIPSRLPRLLSLSPDGRTITSLWGSDVHAWTPRAEVLATYDMNTKRSREGWPLAVSADGQLYASRTEGGFDVMDLATGHVLVEAEGEEVYTAASFTLDGDMLLLGRMDGVVEAWEIHRKDEGL